MSGQLYERKWHVDQSENDDYIFDTNDFARHEESPTLFKLAHNASAADVLTAIVTWAKSAKISCEATLDYAENCTPKDFFDEFASISYSGESIPKRTEAAYQLHYGTYLPILKSTYTYLRNYFKLILRTILSTSSSNDFMFEDLYFLTEQLISFAKWPPSYVHLFLAVQGKLRLHCDGIFLRAYNDAIKLDKKSYRPPNSPNFSNLSGVHYTSSLERKFCGYVEVFNENVQAVTKLLKEHPQVAANFSTTLKGMMDTLISKFLEQAPVISAKITGIKTKTGRIQSGSISAGLPPTRRLRSAPASDTKCNREFSYLKLLYDERQIFIQFYVLQQETKNLFDVVKPSIKSITDEIRRNAHHNDIRIQKKNRAKRKAQRKAQRKPKDAATSADLNSTRSNIILTQLANRKQQEVKSFLAKLEEERLSQADKLQIIARVRQMEAASSDSAHSVEPYPCVRSSTVVKRKQPLSRRHQDTLKKIFCMDSSVTFHELNYLIRALGGHIDRRTGGSHFAINLPDYRLSQDCFSGLRTRGGIWETHGRDRRNGCLSKLKIQIIKKALSSVGITPESMCSVAVQPDLHQWRLKLEMERKLCHEADQFDQHAEVGTAQGGPNDRPQ